MRKKLFFILFILEIFCCITGCEKTKQEQNNTSSKTDIVTIQGETFQLKSKTSLSDIHYKENYVDFHTDQIGNTRIMNYVKQENTIFEIRIRYDEDRSLSELKAIIETQPNAKEQSKEINNIKYIYYEYNVEDNLKVHHYIYDYKGKVYSIGFFLGENCGNIEEVFMNSVTFE